MVGPGGHPRPQVAVIEGDIQDEGPINLVLDPLLIEHPLLHWRILVAVVHERIAIVGYVYTEAVHLGPEHAVVLLVPDLVGAAHGLLRPHDYVSTWPSITVEYVHDVSIKVTGHTEVLPILTS